MKDPGMTRFTGALFRCFRLGALLLLCMSPAGNLPAAEDRQQWQQPDRVMADLHPQPGATIADVGCGRGYFTFRLARAVGGKGKVLAADVDSEALDSLRQQVAREKLDNVEVIQSAPKSTKLQPASLDAALVCLVLHEASPDD